jgi:hypothetical protein
MVSLEKMQTETQIELIQNGDNIAGQDHLCHRRHAHFSKNIMFKKSIRGKLGKSVLKNYSQTLFFDSCRYVTWYSSGDEYRDDVAINTASDDGQFGCVHKRRERFRFR